MKLHRLKDHKGGRGGEVLPKYDWKLWSNLSICFACPSLRDVYQTWMMMWCWRWNDVGPTVPEIWAISIFNFILGQISFLVTSYLYLHLRFLYLFLWWRSFPSDLKQNICSQDETILSSVSHKLLRMVLVLWWWWWFHWWDWDNDLLVRLHELEISTFVTKTTHDQIFFVGSFTLDLGIGLYIKDLREP